MDFVDRLAAARIGRTYNQYARSELCRSRLSTYLEARAGAETILVGEAPGLRAPQLELSGLGLALPVAGSTMTPVT